DLLFRPWWEEASTDAEKLRVVIDQVASLTESRLERLDKSASSISAAWG
ncbi:MAG: deoxyguanosinetriphosphate triphosphohydrolase, partial [Candidatus Corynebacterium faecigallinarum]